jgi:hypothetical protein
MDRADQEKKEKMNRVFILRLFFHLVVLVFIKLKNAILKLLDIWEKNKYFSLEIIEVI